MNKNTKRSISSRIGRLSTLSIAIGAALFTASANAQLTQNITIGNPKALALGNAVTADPPGIDSIHFNPAGLAKIKGRQRQLKVLAAHMTFDADFGDRHLEKAQIKEGSTSVEQAYNDLNCPSEANGCYPDDPIANTSSSTSTPLLMLPGNGLTETPALVVPLGGIAVEDPNYGWTFATSVYSPQAIGYEREEDDPGAFQGQKLGITRLTYFSPSIGLQFNEELAIGASIGFSWQGFGLETKLRAPETTLAFLNATADELAEQGVSLDPVLGTPLDSISPYDNVGSLSLELEDALSLSFNVGLLWEPTEWISFGVVYQSEATSNLEGDFKMEHSDSFVSMTESLVAVPVLNTAIGLIAGAPLDGKEVVEGTAELELINPAHFSIGTSVKLFPNLKVNIDLKWTDYAAWDNLEINFDENIDFLTVSSLVYATSNGFGDEDNADSDKMIIQRNYESVWSWAIGAEYEVNDNLVLRFGYEPRKSSVPEDRVDLLAPLAEADLYSIGFGLQLDQYSRLDASYAYLESSFTSQAGESESLNSTIPGQVVYNPYAFLDVEATTTAHIFALTYEEKF